MQLSLVSSENVVEGVRQRWEAYNIDETKFYETPSIEDIPTSRIHPLYTSAQHMLQSQPFHPL